MADSPADNGNDSGTPRWVKTSAIVTGVLVVAVVAMMLSGHHGPGRHAISSLAADAPGANKSAKGGE